MALRHLYVLRHGAADPFGELSDTGHQQPKPVADRFDGLAIDAVWH